MTDALPLIAGFRPQALIAWNGAQTVTQAQFVAQVQTLAQQLPAARYALNLCEDRYRFMLAFCAAVLRGQTNLLPHSNAPGVIADLERLHPDHHRLDDANVAPPSVRDAHTIPLVAATHPAALVMTSGSTGTPRFHTKHWGVLARTAQLSRAALMPDPAAVHIVATVPPQHMFGLETTVFYALATGCAVHHARPFFPADIRDTLAAIPAPRVLVTTPIHLRALLQTSVVLPPLTMLLSATAPLSLELARTAEQRFGAPLREIYGCTEAGSLATRRLTDTTQWTLHAGSRIATTGDTATLHAAHLSEPVVLDDAVSIDDERHFQLVGRNADLLKVGGKRASLSELTQKLLEVPGIEDAVVFVPEGQERPAALVVAAALSETQVLAALAPQLDPVFLPRPLRCVAQLPRNAVGKLSRATLMAMLAS